MESKADKPRNQDSLDLSIFRQHHGYSTMCLANVKSKNFFRKNTTAFFAVSHVLDNATNAFDAPKA
jgi:hypothetical protein